MANLVKTARTFVLAVALLGVPFVVDMPTETKGLSVNVNAACADPSECASSVRHICRLGDDNFRRYKCSRGCDAEV